MRPVDFGSASERVNKESMRRKSRIKGGAGALNRCWANTVRLYPSSRDGVPERRDNQSAIPRAIL